MKLTGLLKFWPPQPPPPGTPPRVGWVKTNCIDFLDSSWHFPDFWFFDPLKFPLRPPLVGGGVKKFFIDFLDSSWNLPDFLNFNPQPPPLEPPRGGMGKNKFIDFLDSSWHFPDFWFFDPLKFPLRPPPLGWGGQFFLGRNHPQICRDLCILIKSLFRPIFCIQSHNILSFCRLCISSLGNNMAPWTTWPDFSGTAHDVTLFIQVL